MRTENLPVVDCPQEPRARGRAHGEALRMVIAAKIGRWHAAIGEAYGQPAEPFLARFLSQTDFRPAIREFTPDLLEEVEGIAEGAAIAPDIAYALQLMDEEWWFGKAGGDGHCSSLAVAPGESGPTLVAQTMDLPRWHDGAQAVLRLDDGDHETLVFTSAGMIGLMGASGRGLGICVNTLSQLGVSATGLPVAFAMRAALASRNAGEAAAVLQRIRHASGQNYQIGDRAEARTLECSTGGAVTLDFDHGRSLHTNHPLKSRDAATPGTAMGGSDNSRARLASLAADLPPGRPATVDAIKAALSACRSDGAVSIALPEGAPLTEMMTVGAVIHSIGDSVSMSVAAGPPSAESWISLPVR